MKTIILTIVVLIGSAAVSAQTECNRYSEPSKGLTICVPVGFVTADNPGRPFKKFLSRGDDFTSNVNLLLGTTTRNLEAYVTSEAKGVFATARNEGYENFGMVAFTDFATNAGNKGFRTEYTFSYKGLPIRTIQYYFQRTPTEMVIITTTTLQGNTVVPSRSDASMKTLVLKP